MGKRKLPKEFGQQQIDPMNLGWIDTKKDKDESERTIVLPKQKHQFTCQGINLEFPFKVLYIDVLIIIKPYPSQIGMVNCILQALKREQNALLERYLYYIYIIVLLELERLYVH
jgi:hypothetical protein